MKNNTDLIAGIYKLASKDQGAFNEVVKYLNGSEKNFDKVNSAINTIANIQKELAPAMSNTDAKDIARSLRQ